MFEVEASWAAVLLFVLIEFEDTFVLKVFDFGGVGQEPVDFA